jgi:hypothetical protein
MEIVPTRILTYKKVLPRSLDTRTLTKETRAEKTIIDLIITKMKKKKFS